jgi:hypothetical protein
MRDANAQTLDHVLLGAPKQLRSACSERAGQRRGLPKGKCSQRMCGTQKRRTLSCVLVGARREGSVRVLGSLTEQPK